jgi:hypothetical protein
MSGSRNSCSVYVLSKWCSVYVLNKWCSVYVLSKWFSVYVFSDIDFVCWIMELFRLPDISFIFLFYRDSK